MRPNHTAKVSGGTDMLHGPLLKKMILFALPLALSSMLQQLFNAADTAVVGRFASSQAMAAVGSNSAIINLVVGLFTGISVGANVVVSSLIGRGDDASLPDAIHTCISISLISGVLLLIAGQIVSVPLLLLVNTPEDVIGLASLYLRIYFLGMPFVMLYNFGAAILRSRGDSERPLFALTAAGIINVFLNLLLVIVFRLHVIGVGAATVISNIVSALLVLFFLCTEEEPFRLDLRKLRIRRQHLVRVLKIGLPAGVQGVVFSLSNTVILSAVNSFGAAASAGSAAALNFEIIAYYAVNAFNLTAVTFTSQNYAAGLTDRCKKVFRIAFLGALISAGCLDLCFVLQRGIWLRIFSTDPEVLAFAYTRFLHVLLMQWMVSSYEISGAAMRGMGYSMTPSVLMIFGTCVFRIFWTAVVFPRSRDFGMLLNVYPASWVLTGSMVMISYFLVRRRAFRKLPSAAHASD
ncbi:MAG: MATE family efflux transporter [Lachnospiraceae bacterium]|nr:MATE family efflux transporter [Lachnospiraceae bacterium]